MSKTTEIQIEKSRNLIEGLRRHVREMGERGISNNEINEMEKTVAMLSEANAEVDRLREELTPKVKKIKHFDFCSLIRIFAIRLENRSFKMKGIGILKRRGCF